MRGILSTIKILYVISRLDQTENKTEENILTVISEEQINGDSPD